jgi:hypothetical protein
MLVHVTRYVDVQALVYEQIVDELRGIVNRLRHGDGNSPDKIIDVLKALWSTDFVPTSADIDDPSCSFVAWADVKKELLRSAAAIQVKQINGSAGDVLDYYEHKDQGLNVVVIGGDKLSRGLTLEGLSVSYFLRASRMYDTLMQMGRWFGYRPGYLDLCRLYTPQSLIDWFGHITAANDELRQEFNRMALVGATPREYGHRVRSHPYLLVTSQVKMRSGRRLELSYSCDVSETVSFYPDKQSVHKNYGAARDLFSRLSEDGAECEPDPVRERPDNRRSTWKGGVVWTGVRPEVVTQFLSDYRVHEHARRVRPELLADYIEKQKANGDLVEWTVLLTRGEGKTWRGLVAENHEMNLVKRAGSPSSAPGRFSIRRVVSGRDEAIDLTLEEYGKALALTVAQWENDPVQQQKKPKPTEPSGDFVRTVRSPSRGVLVMYPLDPTGVTEEGEQGPPLIGFALSFPLNEHDRKVSYVVNNVYYEQEYGKEDR